MHRFRRIISSFRALAIVPGAIAALGLGSPAAQAQSNTADDGSGPVKRFVFTAAGEWGAAQDAAIRAAGGTVVFSHTATGLGIASSSDPGFIRRALKGGALVKGAEDMLVQWQDPAELRVSDESVGAETVTPGDETFIDLQWNMTAIEAAGAWSLGYDGAGVRVAVIDGGTCTLHPDLAPNLDVARSASFVPGFTFDQDTGGPTAFRHACHVAGIIAAADNGTGTIGVAPRATIIAIKALHGGSGTFGAVIQSILYASDPIAAGGAGADIINLSLGAAIAMGGGNTGTAALVAALNRAMAYANTNNVLVVCSAGGSATDLDHSGSVVHVPSQSGNALAISATAPVGFAVGWPNGATNFRDPASYTDYGRSAIWVSAPGGDSVLPGSATCTIPPVTSFCWLFDLILSPGSQNGGYFFAGGTSMAAPHVAGVAALIRQQNPGISAGDLKNKLKNSADDEGEPGNDPYHGHGFVNARRAVTGSAQQAAATPALRLEPAAAGPRVAMAVDRGQGGAPEISFTLESAGPARVELFDVAGRRVAVPFSGQATAGLNQVRWDGAGLHGRKVQSGVYFARLTANGVHAARGMVFLGP